MTNTHNANLVRYTEASDYWVSADGFNRHENGQWIEYTMKSRYIGRMVRFSVLYVGPEGEARREHGGPVLPGPYAALIPQATIISAHAVEQPTEVTHLEDGDTIMLNGQPMRVIDDSRMNYPSLVTPEEFETRDARRKAYAAAK